MVHATVHTTQVEIASRIAERVRADRARRGWTLDELAGRSGISRRHVVQIEQAEANPSIATLLKLATALDIPLTELIGDGPQGAGVTVVPAQDAAMLWSTPAGSAARLLVHHGALELWEWLIEPGDRRTSRPHRPGSVELLTVLEGTLLLDVDHHQVEVAAGDSARFEATVPHGYANPGPDVAIFTLVVLDPA